MEADRQDEVICELVPSWVVVDLEVKCVFTRFIGSVNKVYDAFAFVTCERVVSETEVAVIAYIVTISIGSSN